MLVVAIAHTVDEADHLLENIANDSTPLNEDKYRNPYSNHAHVGGSKGIADIGVVIGGTKAFNLNQVD